MATTTTQPPPPKKGMTRRQRAKYFRWIQYAIGIIILIVIAFLADWKAFANAFLNVQVALKMFPEVITTGLKNTLIYTVLAFIFGFVLGVIIALMRLSSVRVYRVLGGAYVELFRGLPSLLVLFLVALGIPRAFPGFQFPGGFYGQVMVGLGLTAAAYMAETIRAGIQAVPKGQVEAAYALGMRKSAVMRIVQLPQAIKIMTPAIISQCIVALKDTSLGYIIVAPGLTYAGRQIWREFDNHLQVALVLGAIYIILNLCLEQLGRFAQRRLTESRTVQGDAGADDATLAVR